jgi:hypothetical protein
MARYFLICASKVHVLKGVAGGFAQAGHGRKAFISKPAKGDWIIFILQKIFLKAVNHYKSLLPSETGYR